jgi:hypothetical protein
MVNNNKIMDWCLTQTLAISKWLNIYNSSKNNTWNNNY